jgi:hypothetical protein
VTQQWIFQVSEQVHVVAREDSMIRTKIVGMAGVAAIAFMVVLLLVKLIWAWTIPDLFPGAVEQGLVAGSISWLTAMKVAILLAVLSAFARG